MSMLIAIMNISAQNDTHKTWRCEKKREGRKRRRNRAKREKEERGQVGQERRRNGVKEESKGGENKK